jgi:hypothetical protein
MNLSPPVLLKVTLSSVRKGTFWSSSWDLLRRRELEKDGERIGEDKENFLCADAWVGVWWDAAGDWDAFSGVL